MQRATRLVLAAVLLSITGCELINPNVAVLDDEFSAQTARLAISLDGDFIWVDQVPPLYPGGPPNYDGGRLTAIDAATGTIVLDMTAFPPAFAIRDLVTAYEAGREGEVWVLHDTGLRTRWNELGDLTGLENPIPTSQFPADSRTHCAMARDLNGNAYLTVGDTLGVYTTYYLYRHAAGVWTRTQLDAAQCPDTHFDLALQEVAVLIPSYDPGTDVIWFHPDTLAETHDVVIHGHEGDFVAFNHNIAVAGSNLYVYDEQGSQTDVVSNVNPIALDTHYGNNMVQVWWSGTESTYTNSVGWFQLD